MTSWSVTVHYIRGRYIKNVPNSRGWSAVFRKISFALQSFVRKWSDDMNCQGQCIKVYFILYFILGITVITDVMRKSFTFRVSAAIIEFQTFRMWWLVVLSTSVYVEKLIYEFQSRFLMRISFLVKCSGKLNLIVDSRFTNVSMIFCSSIINFTTLAVSVTFSPENFDNFIFNLHRKMRCNCKAF